MERDQQEAYFKNFLSNLGWEKQKAAFEHLFGRPIWWEVNGKIDKHRLRFSKRVSECDQLRHGRHKTSNCYRDVLRGLKKAGETHHLERFVCHRNLPGLACPILKDGEVVGVIGVCHIQADIPNFEDIADLFCASINSVAYATGKEMELTDLYKTLHPRAIALSTAHTVHRIMSSTLNLGELLPRIARLTLQALRAKRCSIMLLDEMRKFLLPKVDIGLKNKDIGGHRLPLGKGIPGKVAKTGSFYFSRRILCAPLVEEDVIGVITVWERSNGEPFASTDKEILSLLAEQAVIAIKNARLYEDQQKLTIGSIKSLAAILDLKTPYKYTPSPAFVNFTLACGKELRLSEKELTSLRHAVLLHDAGKISISEDILTKPARLTDKEYGAIKKHPYKGVKLIKPIDVLKPTIPIILYHHERYDGSGYPQGLKGDEIPLGARIMAVTDAFWAMTGKRPYRKKISTKEAVAEIRKYSGTQFDPKVVAAFLRVIRKPQIKVILRGRD